jgi:hypothetical protein
MWVSLASFYEAFITEKPFQRSTFIGITRAMVGVSSSILFLLPADFPL